MVAKTRAQLNADADTLFPDNNTGEISPADIRTQAKNMADSAKLAEDLATVATSGAYGDLSGKPTLGTAAAKDTGTGAGQVPLLDAGGKLDVNTLPAVAITDTFVVASQAAMLALTAEKGDIAIRTDLNKSFVLQTNSPSTLADWKELLTPTDAVLSVAGLVGAITAAALRTALNLVVGTDVQAYSSVLAATTASFTTALLTKLNGIATGATANSPDATLLARANHTGTQSADTITDGTTNKAYTATEKTKLAAVGTMANRAVTISSAAPSGGADGDMWVQY